MSALSDLHTIIQVLSQAEKRNFTRMATAYQDSQLGELFSILHQQKSWNAKSIENEIRKAGFYANSPTLTARLRRQIINSQRVLYSDENTNAKLSYLLAEVRYLYERNLTTQALRVIRKAKKLAMQFSKVHIALELNSLHRHILLDAHEMGESYSQIREEEGRLLELANLQLKLHDLHLRARALAREALQGHTDQHENRLELFLFSPDIQTGLVSEHFLCRVYALYAVGVTRFAMQEFEAAKSAFSENIQLWQSYPEWINEQPKLFLSSFSNFQTCLMMLESTDTQMLTSIHAHFSKYTFQKPDIYHQFERISYSNRLIHILNNGEFEAGNALALEITSWLSANTETIPLSSRLALWFNLFTLFFLQGNYSEANKKALMIMQIPGTEERKDIRQFIQIAQLPIQLELGNEDLLENLHRNLSRQFKGKGKLPWHLNLTLQFFAPVKGKQIDTIAYQKLLNQLSSAADRKAQSYLGYRELLLWAESHLTGQSIKSLFLGLLGKG